MQLLMPIAECIHYILIVIQQTSGPGLIRKYGFESQITLG